MFVKTLGCGHCPVQRGCSFMEYYRHMYFNGEPGGKQPGSAASKQCRRGSRRKKVRLCCSKEAERGGKPSTEQS